MIMLLAPWMVQAQTETLRFSLTDAIQQAIDHNKQLRSSRVDAEIYRQKIRETISQGLPQVSGTVNYTTQFNHKMDFGGMSITMKDQSSATLAVNQLIFNGQWIVGVQTSKIAKLLMEQQVELTELDITESICNSYYTILVTERMKEILRGNLENMNTLYEHTRNMFNVGMVEETDVDQLRINVGQLKNSLSSMDRTIELSYNLLRLQMGLEPGDRIALSDELGGFLNETMYNRLLIESFDLDRNLQYQLLTTQTELNKKALSAEKWSFAPTIGGSYSFNHKLLKPELDMSAKHTAAFQMSIPIFSGMQKRSKLNQAKLELEKSYLTRELTGDQLSLQYEQLQFEMKNALENYQLQKENIEVATRVLRNYQRKYELGALSSMELTQANTNYLQAENNYTGSVLTLLQARLNMEKLLNELPNSNL